MFVKHEQVYYVSILLLSAVLSMLNLFWLSQIIDAIRQRGRNAVVKAGEGFNRKGVVVDKSLDLGTVDDINKHQHTH